MVNYKLKLFLRRNPVTQQMYFKLFKLKNKKKSNLLNSLYKEVTQIIYEAFESESYEYFYEFGSLLGIIRDKRFIEYDDDIDLAIIPHNYEEVKKLPQLLTKYGFSLKHYYVINDMITEYNFEYNSTGLTIDVFIKTVKDNSLVTYIFEQRSDQTYSNANERSIHLDRTPLIGGARYENLWGVDLRVPLNAEELLYYYYGEGWKIKDPNFKAGKAPGYELSDERGYIVNVK